MKSETCLLLLIHALFLIFHLWYLKFLHNIVTNLWFLVESNQKKKKNSTNFISNQLFKVWLVFSKRKKFGYTYYIDQLAWQSLLIIIKSIDVFLFKLWLFTIIISKLFGALILSLFIWFTIFSTNHNVMWIIIEKFVDLLICGIRILVRNIL